MSEGNATILAVHNSPGRHEDIRWDVRLHDEGKTIHRNVPSAFPAIPGFSYVGAEKGGCWAVRIGKTYEFLIPARPQVLMCDSGDII